jgi:hypothetical protein
MSMEPKAIYYCIQQFCQLQKQLDHKKSPKCLYPFQNYEIVDWYSHVSSIECLPHNILWFTQRFIINWLPQNHILFDRNRSPTNKCQTCNVEIEMERHFFWCEKNSQHGGKLHESLSTAFNKHTVDPNLRKMICQGLVYAISAEPSKEEHIIKM